MRKGDLLLGDVRGLELDDPVEWPGLERGVYIISVQLLPGLLGVCDRSVNEETQDCHAKPALKRCFHIPRTWVHCDCGI